MAKNAISVLQEYRQKHVQKYPIYSEIFSLSGSHMNKFHCRCECDEHKVIGEGLSKKDAKIAAAEKMIQTLRAAGRFDQIYEKPVASPSTSSTSSTSSRSSTPDDAQIPSELLDFSKSNSPASPGFVNYVGMLQEICVKNNLRPTYADSPCAEGFESTCSIGEYVGRGKSLKKKDAKQLSAERLVKILIENYPHIAPTTESAEKWKEILKDRVTTEELNLENLKITTRIPDLKHLQFTSETEENLARENAKEMYNRIKNQQNDEDTVAKAKRKHELQNFHVLFKQSLDKDVLNKYNEFYKNIKINDSTPKVDQLQQKFDRICQILGVESKTEIMKTDGNFFMVNCQISSYPMPLQEIGMGTTAVNARMNGLSRIIFTINVLLN